MPRRFGRSWSAALALTLSFILFATYYTFRPLRRAPAILVESESGGVVDNDPSSDRLEQWPGYKYEKAAEDTLTEPGVIEGSLVKPTTLAHHFVSTTTSTRTHLQDEQQPTTTLFDPTTTVQTRKPEDTLAPAPPPAAAGQEPDETAVLDDVKDDEKQTTPEDTGRTHITEGYAVDPSELEAQPPPPPPPSKILVMGKLSSEDTDWVGAELADWQNHIYTVDLGPEEESPTGHKTKMNKAREAMPYLTYIVRHYPDFPDVVAFLHPHRRGLPMAWHNDARGHDAVAMMQDLKIETVLERGYVNLRCNNEVGCPDEVQPFRDPPDPERFAEHAYPYIYAHFFNVSFEQMREQIPVVATQCCAQFAVSREQILKRPKQEYVRYQKFLEETHYDDATVGRVMEYMWHIIFGRDAVHCENVFDCWCAVYGRCFGHRQGGGSNG